MGKVLKNVKKIIDKEKGLNFFDLLSTGLVIGGGVSAYNDARAKGHGAIGSVATAVGDAIMFDVIGLPGMIAYGVASSVPTLAVKAVNKVQQLSRQSSRQSYGNNIPFYNANFNDTQQAYTMRQMGMQLAENSKYNLQQSLMGNEASMLHM